MRKWSIFFKVVRGPWNLQTGWILFVSVLDWYLFLFCTGTSSRTWTLALYFKLFAVLPGLPRLRGFAEFFSVLYRTISSTQAKQGAISWRSLFFCTSIYPLSYSNRLISKNNYSHRQKVNWRVTGHVLRKHSWWKHNRCCSRESARTTSDRSNPVRWTQIQYVLRVIQSFQEFRNTIVFQSFVTWPAGRHFSL